MVLWRTGSRSNSFLDGFYLRYGLVENRSRSPQSSSGDPCLISTWRYGCCVLFDPVHKPSRLKPWFGLAQSRHPRCLADLSFLIVGEL